MTAAPTFTLKDFVEVFGTNHSLPGDEDPVVFAKNVMDDAARSLAVLYDMLWREAQTEPDPAENAADFTHNVRQRLLTGIEVLGKLSPHRGENAEGTGDFQVSATVAKTPAEEVAEELAARTPAEKFANIVALAENISENLTAIRQRLDFVPDHHKDEDTENVLLDVSESHGYIGGCESMLRELLAVAGAPRPKAVEAEGRVSS